jgi:uncharacterized membrane protein
MTAKAIIGLALLALVVGALVFMKMRGGKR